MFICLRVLTCKNSRGHFLDEGRIVPFLCKELMDDFVYFKCSSEGSNETETSAPSD